MFLHYAQTNHKDKYKRSIFLAGPSPRDDKTFNWRNDAIDIFKSFNPKIDLYIPLPENGFSEDFEYNKQIEWELNYMNKSNLIIFWIPRDIKTLPGFTTNIEFGYWLGKNPSKILVGFPPNSDKNNYIEYICNKYHIPLFNSLKELIEEALEVVGE